MEKTGLSGSAHPDHRHRLARDQRHLRVAPRQHRKGSLEGGEDLFLKDCCDLVFHRGEIEGNLDLRKV